MQGSLRETLFNVLRPRMEGAHVLDLFAGTGSLGLEALSRGAACCTFFEGRRAAAAVLAKNISLLECDNFCELFTLDLLRLDRFPKSAHKPFDIVFLDPPFRFMDPGQEKDLSLLITLLFENGYLSKGAVLTYQLRKKQKPPQTLHDFTLDREKRQGSVRLAFYCC